MLIRLLPLLFLAQAAIADPIRHGDLLIDDLHSFETPPTARTAAGYFTVTNTGDAADVLVAIEAAFPRVELHRSQMTDGVMSMRHVAWLELPAGTTLTLQPGGLHVMFMGLDGDPFEPGEAVPATLVFQNAGAVDVTFVVQSRR